MLAGGVKVRDDWLPLTRNRIIRLARNAVRGLTHAG